MDIGNRTLSMVDLQKNTLVSGNKAMQMLELSRHSFEKVVKDGLLTIIYENGKKYYQIAEIEAFMSTDTYTELVNGVVDPRNSLNDLTGKDWLPETKSLNFFIFCMDLCIDLSKFVLCCKLFFMQIGVSFAVDAQLYQLVIRVGSIIIKT